MCEAVIVYAGPDRVMPTQRRLCTDRHWDLLRGIKRNGGFAIVVSAAGLAYGGRSAPRRWTTVRLDQELMAYVGPDERMPTRRRLRQERRWDLCGAICRAGGYSVVARAIGLKMQGRATARSEAAAH